MVEVALLPASTTSGALRSLGTPAGAGSRGAPRDGLVVVEEREQLETFASGDGRITVHGHLPGTWVVTGKGSDISTQSAPPS